MGADASRGWLLSLACWCWGRARNNTPVYDWLAGHGQWHVAGGFVHWRPRALCGSIGELSFSFSFALVFFFGQRIFVHKMSCRIARAESLLGCERIYSSCSVQTCPLYFYDLPVLTYQHDPTCPYVGGWVGGRVSRLFLWVASSCCASCVWCVPT